MFAQKSTRERFQFSRELKGILFLGLSIIVFLSLLSHAISSHGRNWLGFIGDSLASCLYYSFGIGALLIPIFLSWIGSSHLFKRHFSNFALKITFFSLLLFSFCTFLAVIGNALRLKTFLGGVPFHQLYIGIQPINFFFLLGSVGTFLTFLLATLLLSLLLTGISPPLAGQWVKKFFVKSYQFFKLCIRILRSFAFWKKFKKKKTEKSPNIKMANNPHPFEGAEVEEISFLRKHPLNVLKNELNQSNDLEKEVPVRPIPIPLPHIISNHDNRMEEIETAVQGPPIGTPIRTPATKRAAALDAQRLILGDFSLYKLPPIDLLTQVKKVDQTTLKNDLRRYAIVLEETLLSFGIEAKVGEIHCGPTITSFEVHPAIGVKVQKIKALENDLALNMQAKSIRIIAPIPGKAAVGIEVPNPRPQEVSFKEMMENYHAQEKKLHLPILLGKMVNGDDVVADLTKMPHCIIAGATGSGKSVCINTIVMSILMNMPPDVVKLLMVDPKKVELTAYSNLPHMIAPVITEPQGACAALNWLVKEMENRYEIFRQIGTRNILSFNHREINKEMEQSLEISVPDKLPYIVVIIDELADLMMVSSSDIETPIARIAQMARAVGIHLVLATQRPSREVITGLIKANFPTRIAFKVASRVNSQIIIDETGAEALLGNGDMLFLPPGTSNLVRSQGAFIRDDDINRVIKYISDQAPAKYLIPSFDQDRGGKGENPYYEEDPVDSLYDQALSIVLDTGTASTTFLQRKLKIGYARAASLMDQLESRGIIGPQEGAKPRKILYPTNKSSSDEKSINLVPEEE